MGSLLDKFHKFGSTIDLERQLDDACGILSDIKHDAKELNELAEIIDKAMDENKFEFYYRHFYLWARNVNIRPLLRDNKDMLAKIFGERNVDRNSYCGEFGTCSKILITERGVSNLEYYINKCEEAATDAQDTIQKLKDKIKKEKEKNA